MKFTVTVTVEKTEGPDVEPEDIAAALAEHFTGETIEAGEEPSVFDVSDADAEPAEEG